MEIKIKDTIFKYEIEGVCKACNGTGLYTGCAERDGAYVVCRSCKGTGKKIYKGEYELFKSRKVFIDNEVKRVFAGSGGFCISANDIITEEGKAVPFSQYGCTYKEFLEGREPSYVECLCCPLLADQGACHKIKGFTDKCNKLNGGWIYDISTCKYQDKKSECWKRFKNGN